MTYTVLLWADAFVINERTIEERNVDEPINVLAVIMLLPDTGSFEFESLLADEAVEDIEENISGAPFPNAKSVTPARDYVILNVTVNYSKD